MSEKDTKGNKFSCCVVIRSRSETRLDASPQSFGPRDVDTGVGWLMVSADSARRAPERLRTSEEVGPLDGQVEYFRDPALEASGVNANTYRPWVVRRSLRLSQPHRTDTGKLTTRSSRKRKRTPLKK